MILIDSDILIWILRGNIDIKKKFIQVIENIETKIFITPVQIAEIFAGLKEKEKIDTSLFLDSLPCLVLDEKTGKLSGEYLQEYGKSHGVTLADAVIGAVVKLHGLKLWTLNKKHYPMISVDDFFE